MAAAAAESTSSFLKVGSVTFWTFLIWYDVFQGVLIWIRDEAEVWKSCELLENFPPDAVAAKRPVSIRLADGEEREELFKELPFLRNPDILIGRDDLTTLSYLHEPAGGYSLFCFAPAEMSVFFAVLFNLKHRFLEQQIYTYCGIVLVAINPYKNIPDLYGDEIIQASALLLFFALLSVTMWQLMFFSKYQTAHLGEVEQNQ